MGDDDPWPAPGEGRSRGWWLEAVSEQGLVEAGKRGPDGVVRNHLSSGKGDHIMAGPIIVGRASMVKQADAAVAANMG